MEMMDNIDVLSEVDMVCIVQELEWKPAVEICVMKHELEELISRLRAAALEG